MAAELGSKINPRFKHEQGQRPAATMLVAGKLYAVDCPERISPTLAAAKNC